MKKRFIRILAAVLTLCCLSGCGTTPTPVQTDPTPPQTSETTPPPETTQPPETTLPPEPTVPQETLDPALNSLRENLPVMDGSTSLIPLEAGLRAALFSISLEEATAQVSHTSSWGSFYNLLSGNADLVFSVPLSQEQRNIAAEEGVTLEAIPIAMEGFVFVVNAENPVDTLTQQQIKDIYSGKITNWSELGGLDEEIIAYQRNQDSGSQNYMIEFMGDTPLMDAPSELRPASMVGLMDVIAVNDNSRAAIGYSVYAYAADMYGNGNEIKFIQVDGVAPSKATFADGSYPLMGYNYAIYNENEPEDSFVRQLVDWILSDEGQTAIADAGYVTVRDIGYDYSEKTIEKYEGVGLGAPAPDSVPTHEYVLLETVHHVTQWGQYDTHSNSPRLDHAVSPDGIPFWHISQLADKALEEEINSWIDAQIAALLPEISAMEETVAQLVRNYEYPYYYFPNLADGRKPVYCSISLKNGYLSVSVSLCYWKTGNDEHLKYYRTESAVWDLINSKQLSNEELFYEGVDIDSVLNTHIQEYTQTTRGEFMPKPEMKQDFVALPETGWHLTFEGIYIDNGSEAFLNGEFIPFDNLPEGVLVSDTPRDFSDSLILDDTTEVIRPVRTSSRDLKYVYSTEDGENYVVLLKEEFHPNAAQINEDLLDYTGTYYDKDTIIRYFAELGYSEEKLDLLWMDWYSTLLGGRYLLVEGNRPYVYNGFEDRFIYYPYDSHLLYDLETGKRIDWTDLLQGDWLANSTMNDGSTDEPVETPFYEGLETDWFQYYSDINRLCVYLRSGNQGYYLHIPGEYIIF